MKIKLFIKENQLVLILLFLSLLIRFYYSLSHIEFDQDVARDLVLMSRYLKEKAILIPYGPKTSIGNFYVPPFYYQIHYFISIISKNSLFAIKLFCTLIESFTVLVLYKILTLFFRKNISFIGSIVYLINYFPIIMGVRSWNPTMIPFVSSLALYFWMNYLIKGKIKSVSPALFFSSLILHLHYQALFLSLFIVGVFIYGLIKKDKSTKYWLLGTALSLLPLLPYFIHEIAVNFQNTKNIIYFITKETPLYYARVSKIAYIKDFYPTFIEKIFFNRVYSREIIGRLIFYLGMMGFLTKIILKKEKKLIPLFLYMLSIFVMLRVYKGDKLEYYMSILYILPSVLISVLLSFNQKIISNLIFVFIIFIALLSGLNMGRDKTKNDFKTLEKTTKKIKEYVKNENVRFIFHDDDLINTFAYAFENMEEFNLNSNAELIVDVCKKDHICQWQKEVLFPLKYEGLLVDRAYVYSSLLKSSSKEYEFIANIKTPSDYQISISAINDPPKINYNISNDYNYGHDFLLNEIIY